MKRKISSMAGLCYCNLYVAAAITAIAPLVAIADDEKSPQLSVTSHLLESEYQAHPTTVRVLLPDSLQPNQVYQTLYVLPVVAGDDRRFGDGLIQFQQLDYHNQYQLICVAPEFSTQPWYADNDQDDSRRDESHLLKVVIPFIESKYPAGREASRRLLIGFSKSGWGAFSLLLRHPTLFHRAAGFDPGVRVDVGPISEQERAKRISRIFGTAKNFEKYRLSTLIQQPSRTLGDQPRLLYLNTRGKRAIGGAQLHQLMIEHRIPHHYQFTINRSHRWDSGWIPSAVEFLVNSKSDH